MERLTVTEGTVWTPLFSPPRSIYRITAGPCTINLTPPTSGDGPATNVSGGCDLWLQVQGITELSLSRGAVAIHNAGPVTAVVTYTYAAPNGSTGDLVVYYTISLGG